MDWLDIVYFNLTNDDKIRFMGWSLLLMWMMSIIYMTRDFWFPSAYGLPPLSERISQTVTPVKVPYSPSGLSLKRLSQEIQMIEMEKERLQRLMLHRKHSRRRRESSVSV